jgi:carboxypeptidase D
MEGLLTENGPINWLPGMDEPTPNPFTWLILTNVVWIDQPLGVGFSQNFIKTFCMEDWRMYLTGESYAGVYIPYIADAVCLLELNHRCRPC